MTNPRTICRICGYSDGTNFPFGEDGVTPKWEFCACCGVEHGYEDSTLDGIQKFRAEWASAGYQWESPGERPSDWNPQKQLGQIPKISDPKKPYL